MFYESAGTIYKELQLPCGFGRIKDFATAMEYDIIHKEARTMVIDFHTHTFPQSVAERAIAAIQEKGRSVAFTDGTRQGLLASMAGSGVQLSVVLPVATNPAKLASMNAVSIENNGDNGMLYFGAMHPLAENWKEQLQTLADAGIRGIKIHPLYQGVDITDKRYLRILQACGELDLIVVMHAGDDIAYPGQVRCSPKMTAQALRQVGPVKMVLAHMGGWKNWEEVTEYIGPTGAYVDTALSLGKITPLPDATWQEEQLQLLDADRFCDMVRQLGSRRVLFGTDSPWGDPKQDLERIYALPLEPWEKEQMLCQNARRLLNI